MRSTKSIAAVALMGVAMTLALQSPASATGFGHRYYAPRYGARAFAGPPPPPYRYLRCRGGRFYTILGGWGCDYYLSPRFMARR
jgi:hypothetical protein